MGFAELRDHLRFDRPLDVSTPHYGQFLTTRQRDTLAAVAETLLPPVRSADDPYGFWATGAAALDVPAAAEHALATLASPHQQARIRRLLNLLEVPLASAALGAGLRGFSRMTPDQRTAYLRGWAGSSVAVRRESFQALKRLVLFLSYAVPGPTGANPAWAALGYAPVLSKPATPAKLGPTSADAETTLHCDVCVIGSGAGGGVAAAELARTGLRVVVLDRGPLIDEPLMSGGEIDGYRHLYLGGGLLSTDDLGVVLLAGNCVGGGTTINWCSSFRPPSGVLEEWEREHGIPGLTGPEFAEYLTSVEQRLQVTTAESRPAAKDEALKRGAEALGYHAEITPRNVHGCDGGTYCGSCGFGCRRGAKQSTMRTYLEDAVRDGARIVASCKAQRLRISGGKVIGVEALIDTPQGKRPVHIAADRVVVACGALETPALLLRSGLSNPNIGKHLHLHPTTVVWAEYEQRIESWSGVPQAVQYNQFADLDEGYGFRVTNAPAHPGLIAFSLPWLSGLQHKSQMLRAAHVAPSIVQVRDRDEGSVTVDRHGNPHYEYAPGQAMRQTMLEGIRTTAQLHLAAGAREVATVQSKPVHLRAGGRDTLATFMRQVEHAGMGPNQILYFSTQQMSSCRMGADPEQTVVDPWGQVHEVSDLYLCDSSVFPTACGVDPMITIMAMALRTARKIATRSRP